MNSLVVNKKKYSWGKNVESKSPKRELAEIAEEFGLSYGQLVARMRVDETAPKKWCSNGFRTGRKALYDLAEMRKWWESAK